jgi:ribonuclease III
LGLNAEPGALAEVEARLGHVFRDRELLICALTHASYAHEHPPARPNETLAFLGDAVLGLIVAELLCADAPDDGPGPLTQRRAELVSGKRLAAWAVALGLPTRLRLGRGEDLKGGRGKESVLASALEAVVGAVYLDGGLVPARTLIARLRDAAIAGGG